MKSYIFLLLILFSCQSSETESDHFIARIPTPEEEANFIWRTIIDIEFFEQFGYTINLPQDTLIEELKTKSRAKQLSDNDYEKIVFLMKKDIFQVEDYAKGLAKIEAQKPLINQMISELKSENWGFDFQSFEAYEVKLTLYGSGGNFNPDSGLITLFTDINGNFKNYDQPANTIIHEVVHIGIEYPLIQKYQVNHAQKERIVDRFVSLCFEEQLPDYQLQNIGNPGVDTLLKDKKELKNLENLLKESID